MRILCSLVLVIALGPVFADEPSAADKPGQPDPETFVPVDIMPEMIQLCAPEYPDSAKAAGLQGKVYVKALVNKTGNVDSVLLLRTSGHAVLDEAALKAVPDCKFKPAVTSDKPVAVWVTFPIDFKPDDHE